VAIVTGGTRGIGRAIAIGFAQAGADVVATGRNPANVGQITAEIQGMGRNSMAIPADMSRKADIDAMVEKVADRFGRIDILVNSAGINTAFESAENVAEKDWDETLDINLKGLFLCCQAAGRVMIRQKGGKIINITSVNGLAGAYRAIPYCTAKAGIIMLTKCMAIDWVRHNIQVNAIGPGLIDTDLTKKMQENRLLVEKALQRIPQRRFGRPDEVVGTALLLASDMSSFITGQTFFVDGGFTAM
jgi:NAD(P)-dependent dehydrogenase (short-subunit alcohol dehydrogenase family)